MQPGCSRSLGGATWANLFEAGWQHIAVFVSGECQLRGGISGQAGSWFICLAFLISLYHGASVVTPPPVLASVLFLKGLHLGYGRCEGTVPGSFEDISRILLCAGSGLAKHREFGSRRV